MPPAVVICVFVALTAVVSASNINYCGSRMCGNTDAHTFCQYSEGPGPECVGYMNAELSPEEKSRLIGRLNRRRNEAATGRLRGLSSAGNMMKLRWVEELAREAQLWADQCRPPQTPEEHDMCRDLYSVPVGQVIASVVGEAPGLRVESMIDIWYMQNMHYRGNATIYIPPTTNTSFYGDFGQIMWAQSYMVGCGRSRFMIPSQGRLRSVERLVCNIAPRGPPPSRPLWSPSAPATLCPPRSKPDDTLIALCDIKQELTEITEIDGTMTLEEHLLLYTVLDIEQNKTLNYKGSLDEIYLTRLAVATMENIITTKAYFNSLQRRDITEVIILDETTNSTSTTETTRQETSTNPSTAVSKKKPSLIGRPKAYNIDELNDLEYKTENSSPSEDVVKREKEFYAEYDFVENMEENATETMTFANTSVTYNSVFDVNAVYINPLVNNTQMIGAVMNDSDINVEDYLADPETVRELQEALDRLERDMSTENPTDRQGKVRRELRDQVTEEMRPQEQVFDEQTLADLERNKSLERGPMYNMVLKYMPYLKQYEASLLNPATSKATCYCLLDVFLLLESH
ncbi:uncharacterized protein LOC142973833 [Anticarsia gemmatalis]|uniref:uncharacterized protein LOC142973833 n=1 Tax=Anticarsia gemmatalis TaxID=129554 RepID=UPI003F775004